jgi:hypothetical protein
MIEESVAIPGTENRFRLKDEDLVLHAASHLLLNSEFDRALRDLWDIDLLIRHFSEVEPNFGDRVMERARSVGLAQIVYRALFLCHRYFGTPLPTCDLLADGFVMWLFAQSTSTRHPDTRPALQTLADEFLRLRELYLRLPSHLLVRHLWHKANTAMNAGETKPA